MLFLENLERNRRERPNDPYLLHEGRTVTFEEFDRATNRFARVLGRLGIVKGDRVTVALGNSVEWVTAAFGALKAGAILNPVNPTLGSAELGYVLGHAEPRVIVTDRDSSASLLAPTMKLPASATLVSFGDLSGATPLAPLLADSGDDPVSVVVSAGDGSTLLYTSGTTGNPKGVLFTHSRTGGSGAFFISGMCIRPDDVILTVGPLFHGNAWSAVAVAQQAGCTATFPRAFSASDFWPLAERTGATVLFTLGTILAILLTQEKTPAEERNRIRVVLGLGSAPIRDRLRERFGFEHVVECFGSTDAGVVTLEPLGEKPRPGSAGPAIPGVRLHILDDYGRELPLRAVGEIAVESPHRMDSYFRDRKRDVIRRGGENISSVLVEKALREHPAVADVAVIGVRHPVLGQEVKAFVVPRTPVTIEELREFASGRLAKFQVPAHWEFRDSLPRTPTQLVEKYKLRSDDPSSRGPLLG